MSALQTSSRSSTSSDTKKLTLCCPGLHPGRSTASALAPRERKGLKRLLPPAGTWVAGGVALSGDLVGAVEAFKAAAPALVLPAKFVVAFPLVYHYLGGVRHVIWDKAHYGNMARPASRAARLAAAGASARVTRRAAPPHPWQPAVHAAQPLPLPRLWRPRSCAQCVAASCCTPSKGRQGLPRAGGKLAGV